MKTTSILRIRLVAAFELLLALALLFTAAVTPVSAASKCADTHTVEAHETIWRLVKDYGVPAARIAQANGLKRPYTLKVGQEVCIPYKSAGGLGDSVSVSVALTADSLAISGSGFPKAHVYRVKAGSAGDWTVLANVLRSDRDGAIREARFKLPDDLRGKTGLLVCLKDTSTDAVSCFTATAQ
jgi:LysM repeat protein